MAIITPDEFNLPGRLSFTTKSELVADQWRRLSNAANHLWSRQAADRLGGQIFDGPLRTTDFESYTNTGLAWGWDWRTLMMSDHYPYGVADRRTGSGKIRLRFWTFSEECSVLFRVYRVDRMEIAGEGNTLVHLGSFTINRTSSTPGWEDAVIEVSRSSVPTYAAIRIVTKFKSTNESGSASLYCTFVSEDPLYGRAPTKDPESAPPPSEDDETQDPDPDPGFVDPSSYNDLVLWCDNDSLSALGDGDRIGSWDDKSSLDRDLVNSTTAEQPTWDASLSAVHFDGVDDELSSTFSFGSQPNFTVFVALRRVSTKAAVISIADNSDGTTSGKMWSFHMVDGKPKFSHYSGSQDVVAPDIVANDGWDLWCLRVDSANNKIDWFKDGTKLSTTDISTPDMIEEYLVLGNSVWYDHPEMYVRGVIQYHRVLTDSQVTEISNWSSDNWDTGTGFVVADPDEDPNDPEDPEDPDTTLPSGYDYLNQQDTRFLYTWAGGNYRGDDIVLNQTFRDDYIDFVTSPHGQSAHGFNRVALASIMYTYGPIADHFADCQGRDDKFTYIAEPIFDPIRGSSALSVSYGDSSTCDSGTLTMPAVGPSDLRRTLKDMHAAGISIDHLDGQAIWLATDANAEVPMQILRDVLTFNKGSNDPAERFDGISFDIEPHIVGSGPYAGDWWEGTESMTHGNKYNPDWEHRWMYILRECRKIIDAYVQDTGHAFSLSEFQGSDSAYYRQYHMESIDAADDNVHFLVIANYFDGRNNVEGKNSWLYGDREYDGQPITGGPDQYFQYLFNTPAIFASETGGDAEDRQSFGDGPGIPTTGPYDGWEGMFEMYDLFESTFYSKYSGIIGLGAHHGGYPNDNGIRTMQQSY